MTKAPEQPLAPEHTQAEARIAELRDVPQRAASDPAASSWVAASAGSGKTHVLTMRVLRLLLSGSAPERILCLTFTRAAAAEMANRLHARLGRWTIADDDDLRGELQALGDEAVGEAEMIRARQLFARVLETPGGLKIQTLHAFCEALLGRFPVEAGLAANFQLLDDRTTVELLREAREVVLRRDLQRPEPLIERLAAGMAEDAFGDIMGALTRERGRLRRLLAHFGDLDAISGALRAELGLAPDDSESGILAAVVDNASFDPAALTRVAGLMAGSKAKGPKEKAPCLGAWLAADSAGRQAGFAEYCRIFLTQDDKIQKRLLTKDIADQDPEAPDIMAAEAERLYALREKLRALELWRTSQALLALGLDLLEVYQREKQNRALLDFDDLILMARDLLHSPEVASWVLFKLDGGLDHILVDEAQDTNPEQWQIIRALADAFFHGRGARANIRTVFAVGDAKQSIYSFQRADPAAFEEMRAHFADRVRQAQQHWQPVQLELSFRSAPAVLRLVDAVFAEAPARDGVSFSAEEIRHLANRREAGGRVELWPLEQQPAPAPADVWTAALKQGGGLSAERRLARRIAANVSAWIDGETILAATGKPPRAGDIMILMRTRTPLVEDIIRALRARGIAVAGVDRMRLGEQLAVMDLISLAKFVLLPGDDLNLAVLLKSPLIGLSEDALFDLAHGRAGGLWPALLTRRPERPDFEAAIGFLQQQLARADQMPPFEFFSGLLSGLGGRRKLLVRLGREANDPLDEFLTRTLDFERSHPPSLQGFLNWIGAGDEEIKRDADPQRDEVRVMTVHGAKGLEAPIVILPDAASRPRDRQQLFWLKSGASDLAAAPAATASAPPLPLYSPGRKHDEARATAARQAATAAREEEYHRLLYVALTRAEDRLYIAGIAPKGAKVGTPQAPTNSWYAFVEAAMDRLAAPEITLAGAKIRRFEIPAPALATAVAPMPDPEPLAPLPAFALTPAPDEPSPPRPLTPSRPTDADPAVRSPLVPGPQASAQEQRGDPFQRGNLIHKLLQVLPELAPAQWQPAARRYLAQPAHDLSAAAQGEIARTTLAVMRQQDFAALFGPGSRAEVPLVGLVGGQVISGQIDRLCLGDSEIWIVDYKTNRPAPADLAGVAKIYLRQLAAYRALLQKIYPDRTTRCALLWTDGPRLMEIPAEILTPHAP